MAERSEARPDRRPRTAPLDREQAVYEANWPRWIPDHGGQHVLIQGDEVVGFFESRDEALAAGYARFGVVPLFVKPVAPSEPVSRIPNALL